MCVCVRWGSRGHCCARLELRTFPKQMSLAMPLRAASLRVLKLRVVSSPPRRAPTARRPSAPGAAGRGARHAAALAAGAAGRLRRAAHPGLLPLPAVNHRQQSGALAGAAGHPAARGAPRQGHAGPDFGGWEWAGIRWQGSARWFGGRGFDVCVCV